MTEFTKQFLVADRYTRHGTNGIRGFMGIFEAAEAVVSELYKKGSVNSPISKTVSSLWVYHNLARYNFTIIRKHGIEARVGQFGW